MIWTSGLAATPPWGQNIANADAKRAIARKIAARIQPGEVIGAGSGSTSLLTLEAIGARVREEGLDCAVIPTSREIEISAGAWGVAVASLVTGRPDWCYDGADEIDASGNMIKGRGGAMFREKLVMASSPLRLALVDASKFVEALGRKFPVPVEAAPEAVHLVESGLRDLGASEVTLRLAGGKDGPVITESGGVIFDARFPEIGPDLEGRIKCIPGVTESGLFWGFSPEIITGEEGKTA